MDQSIQDAADLDNWSTAYSRAVKPQVLAPIKSTNRKHVVSKYPKRQRDEEFIPSSEPPRELPGDIITSIRKQNRGKANGLFMDSLDVFIRLVNRNCSESNKGIRLLFKRIWNKQIDDRLEGYFTNTYLFCLYKDEKDPDKLRPIGVPTALRRIIANHIARALRRRFAADLWPINWAIGIDGGMNFVVKAAQLEIEKYITIPQMKNNAPSRIFMSLDLKNMFNEVSRTTIFKIVRERYPELLPLVELLYRNPGNVFYRMVDGEWYTQLMEEGVNQGCPLSAVLAALVLNEVLKPIMAQLNQRAAARLAANRPMDDEFGGQSHPKGYIDDCGVSLPLEDALFFMKEFRRLGPSHGCHLNTEKTRALLSTNGVSALPKIREQYGDVIADELEELLDTFSVEPCVVDGKPVIVDGVQLTQRVEVMDGLRLLGQPVGSLTFARKFFAARLDENKADAAKLLKAVPDHHTALRLFAQCTLHKLPHLLGSEILYCWRPGACENWRDWKGPLASGINMMVESFLAELMQQQSMNWDSMLIAYTSIAQGGLGLMDPFTRAIPDFVLTMIQSYRYATVGFTTHKNAVPLRLPPSLAALFYRHVNKESCILRTYHLLLWDIAGVASPARCGDIYKHCVELASFKSMRDRIKQEASAHRRAQLELEARDTLKPILDEVMLASSSFAIIGMCRSVPSHRRPNDLFMINLKMKLHVELYDPSFSPKCLCGQTIDVFGMHTFCCRRVSKKIMHDRIRDDTAEPTRHLLLWAGIIGKGSRVDIEPKRVVPSLPTLRPFDSAFRPVPSLKRTTIPGIDFTITSPKGHVPPSKLSAAPSRKSAPAAKHLIDKERLKLMRDGKADKYNNNTFTGEEIIGELLNDGKVLLPFAISPYGRWGPMAMRFFFGDEPEVPYKFPKTRPHAARMCDRLMHQPCPVGIVPMAAARWKKEKPKLQHFFGHSYTCPTPREYALQHIGLAIANATALHIRDAKQGNLVPPTEATDEDFIEEEDESPTTDPTADDALDAAIRELEEADAEDDVPFTATHNIFDAQFLRHLSMPPVPPGLVLPTGDTFAQSIATATTTAPLGTATGSNLLALEDARFQGENKNN